MSVTTESGRDRARFTAAVLGPDTAPVPTPLGTRVARGVVVGVTSYMLCLATERGEERFLFERATTFWRGGEVGSEDLRVGDDVVVRCSHDGRLVAERVWAQLARVTGVIVDRQDESIVVDPGHGRQRRTVVLPYRTSGRISVRHPRLVPGYVFDAVGVWRDGEVWAARPATTQPPHPLRAAPHRPPVRTHTNTLNGIATWYDPVWGRSTHLDPRALAAGAAYPALDRESHTPGCDARTPCVPLPQLSVGARLSLRNDCTRESGVLEVLGCAAADSWLCDLCPTCGGQGAGRVASLTLVSFIALGGQPEEGCFNATVTVSTGEG